MQIRIENISFSYPSNPVLDCVSLDIRDGEILSILGPNGSGKSTLLRLITRILLPDQGSIFLEGRPLASFGRRELARMIGYVPQEVPWLFPFTVMEVVLMGRAPHLGRLGFESERDVAVCRAIMDMTDISSLADKPITAISGGERQRVLIARALAQEPSALLLDEPNAHLDLSHQLEVLQTLRRLNRDRKLTIAFVSHDLNLAAGFSDRILFLSAKGAGGATIAAAGPPAEVLTSETIREVFGVPVSVDRDTTTGRPRITLHPEFSLTKEDHEHL